MRGFVLIVRITEVRFASSILTSSVFIFAGSVFIFVGSVLIVRLVVRGEVIALLTERRPLIGSITNKNCLCSC